MEYEDHDTPDQTDPSSDLPQPPTPAEFCELTDAIEITLLLLGEHPQIGHTQERAIDLATPGAEMRQMWLIEELAPETEIWLDVRGDIWQVHHGDPPRQEQCKLANLDIGGVWHLKAIVLSFMARIPA
jgi:hypothetical protein